MRCFKHQNRLQTFVRKHKTRNTPTSAQQPINHTQKHRLIQPPPPPPPPNYRRQKGAGERAKHQNVRLLFEILRLLFEILRLLFEILRLLFEILRFSATPICLRCDSKRSEGEKGSLNEQMHFQLWLRPFVDILHF